MPLAAPGLATAGILTFIVAWNEFLLADHADVVDDGAHRAGGDRVLHRVDASSSSRSARSRRRRCDLDPADHPGALLPEADRGGPHRRRRQGLGRPPCRTCPASPRSWPPTAGRMRPAPRSAPGTPGATTASSGATRSSRRWPSSRRAPTSRRPRCARWPRSRAPARTSRGTRSRARSSTRCAPGISVARQGYLGLEVPDGELRYYGSADATPLFLHVLAMTGDGALAGRARARVARGRATGCWARWSAAAACCAGTGGRRAASCQQGWRDSVDPYGSTSQGSGILHEDGSVARAAGGRRRHAGRGARRAARAGAARRAIRRTPRPSTRWPRASARRGTPTRWRSTRTTGRCAARARSSAGCCGPGRRSPAPPSACAQPDVLTDFGLRTLSDRHPCFDPHVLPPRLDLAVRLVAGLGRAARGGARGRPPSASGAACSPASSASGTTPSSTR